MSDSLEAAVGAAKEISLQGRTHRLHELTVGDMADFEQFVKKLRREDNAVKYKDLTDAAKELYGSGNIPPDVFRTIADICTRKVTQEDVEREAQSGSIQTAVFICWKALQHYQPSITLDEVGKLLDISQIPEVMALIGAGEEEADPKNAQPPETSKQK